MNPDVTVEDKKQHYDSNEVEKQDIKTAIKEEKKLEEDNKEDD